MALPHIGAVTLNIQGWKSMQNLTERGEQPFHSENGGARRAHQENAGGERSSPSWSSEGFIDDDLHSAGRKRELSPMF
jgi:hypothetical protein